MWTSWGVHGKVRSAIDYIFRECMIFYVLQCARETGILEIEMGENILVRAGGGRGVSTRLLWYAVV